MTGDAPTEKTPTLEPSVEKAPTVAPSAVGGVPSGGDPALADPVSATVEPGLATGAVAPGAVGGGGAPIAGVEPAPSSAQSLTDRPEVLVGAAFAGGVLLAIIFRRLGS